MLNLVSSHHILWKVIDFRLNLNKTWIARLNYLQSKGLQSFIWEICSVAFFLTYTKCKVYWVGYTPVLQLQNIFSQRMEQYIHTSLNKTPESTSFLQTDCGPVSRGQVEEFLQYIFYKYYLSNIYSFHDTGAGKKQ